MVFTATIHLLYDLVESHIKSTLQLQAALNPLAGTAAEIKQQLSDPFAHISRDMLSALLPHRFKLWDFFVQHTGEEKGVLVTITIDKAHFHELVDIAIAGEIKKDDSIHPENLINAVQERLLRYLGAVELNFASLHHIEEKCYEVAGSLHE